MARRKAKEEPKVEVKETQPEEKSKLTPAALGTIPDPFTFDEACRWIESHSKQEWDRMGHSKRVQELLAQKKKKTKS